MELEARVREQPLVHHGRLVGGEVVADDVDRQALAGLAVDLVEDSASNHPRSPSRFAFERTPSTFAATDASSPRAAAMSLARMASPPGWSCNTS